jgi:bifunctional non-homologous end joining protein LigD
LSLKHYHGKRQFSRTPEPRGAEPAKARRPKKSKSAEPEPLKFVVQLHEASRRHFDFRLELDGVMLSWAVPKGPSLDPLERRLAVHVEDHPMEYNDFEGVIPRGNYGAGSVMIWDEGTYEPRAVESPAKDAVDALRRGYARGDLKFVMHGQKLRGEFALVRIAKGGEKTWLLLKKRDQFATSVDVTHADRSARSGRTMGEIAMAAEKEGRIWLPGKGPQGIDLPPGVKGPERKAPAKTKTSAATKLAKPKPEAKAQVRKARVSARSQGVHAVPAKLKASAEASEPPRDLRLVAWRKAAQIPAELRESPLVGVLDGYRAAATGSADGAWHLRSTGGADLSARFLDVVAALGSVKADLVLDGIVAAVDEDGAARRRGHLAPNAPPRYRFFAYDLVYGDGHDFRAAPVETRLAALAALALPESVVGAPPSFALADTADAPAAVTGVLVRAPDSAYEEQPFLVPKRHDAIGVGVGANRANRPSRAKQSSSKAAPRAAPRTELTTDPTLDSRHEVTRLRQPSAAKRRNLTLTRQEKLYFPAIGKTKGDLLDFYRSVAPLMLPHLEGRPLSLNRHPDGVEGKSFFQKEVVGHVPTWMPTATISSGRSGKTVTYALCADTLDLQFLVNMGCIEINAWLSRVQSINEPDYVVFDLDPGAIEFKAVVEVALTVRKLLDALEVESFPKTSGGRGLHVYVPVSGSNFVDARAFSELLVREVHRLLPNTTSLERSPSKRPRLIYLDYLQNRVGQTMAAPYSVRPRPTGTVSTPLQWSEVVPKLDPLAFTMDTLRKRLDRYGDLWEKALPPSGRRGAAGPEVARLQARLEELLAGQRARGPAARTTRPDVPR